MSLAEVTIIDELRRDEQYNHLN